MSTTETVQAMTDNKEVDSSREAFEAAFKAKGFSNSHVNFDAGWSSSKSMCWHMWQAALASRAATDTGMVMDAHNKATADAVSIIDEWILSALAFGFTGDAEEYGDIKKKIAALSQPASSDPTQ